MVWELSLKKKKRLIKHLDFANLPVFNYRQGKLQIKYNPLSGKSPNTSFGAL